MPVSFRDTIESDKKVASPSILFEPAKGTTFSYEMEFVDQNVPFDRGVLAANGKLGLIPNSRFLGEPGDGPVEVDVLGHQLQFQQKLSRDWYMLIGAGYRDTSFRGFSTEAELTGSRQALEETGNILVRQRRFRDYDTTNLVFRGEVSGKLYTGPLTHHLLVGADWDRFKIDLFQNRYRYNTPYVAGTPIVPAQYAIDIYNPVYGQVVIPNVTITNQLETQKSWGVYLQDQIDVTERLKLRLGGRFDHFNQELVQRPSGATTNVTKERFSPTVGGLYELTDTISFYAAYGTGFRPNSGTDFEQKPFEPETSKSYEAGLRFVSNDKSINASVAAFHMKKSNILTADPVNTFFSTTAGSARSNGIEADLTANILDGLSIIANYAYTDAVWTSTAKDKDFALGIDAGDPLINVPKHQANLLVTKLFDLGDPGKVTIGGGVQYVDKRLGETGTDFYLPSYTIARALASYAPDDSVKVSLDVTNLFDEEYYAASYHRYWIAPGAPRTITGRIDFFF